MNRRDLFLALPAAAVKSSAANSAVSIGLIGAGSRGSFIAKVAHAAPAGRITAVCDIFEEKIDPARKAIGAPDAKAFQDYRKLLESDVDAVIIATPVFLHAEHFEAAVKAGKHIYIEKPAAPDVAGCKRIMRAADSADRRLNITFGFQRRYGHVYQRGKQLLDSGELGKVRWAQVEFLKAESTRRQRTAPPPNSQQERIRNWGDWRELSGDLIVENNIHLIDVMNWYLDAHPVAAIGAGGRVIPGYGDMRDHGTVAYSYPGGVQGTLMGMTVAPQFYRNVFEQFHCEKGVLEVSENFFRHHRGRGDTVEEKAPRNPSYDSLPAFVQRVASARVENTGVRGCESTLTAIMGRMAMDKLRTVTWEEVWNSA
jgi:predicted dehydrogenase